MTFSERVEKFCDLHRIKSHQELAGILGLNYVVMNRNIKANKITIDFILALAVKFPNEDLNIWIKENLYQVNEDSSIYGMKDPLVLIDEIESRMKDLKGHLTQK